ncbi:MAG: hypothetical protein AAF500_06365 [Myxococcota bacterium]
MVGVLGRPRAAVHVIYWSSLVVSSCGGEPLPGDPGCEVDVGDLVLTEVLANPDGADGANEYVEIHNPRSTARSLRGVVLASSRDDGTGRVEHRFGEVEVAGGSYFVVGNASPNQLADHVDYSYGAALGNLRNTSAVLSLWCGQQLIDAVRYQSTRDGYALVLDGAVAPSSDGNDDPTAWCEALDAIQGFAGNTGSPGLANAACEGGTVAGRCLGTDGVSLDSPVVGDAAITEWMANPRGSDADLEWVEVTFTSTVDVGGVRLGTSVDELGASPFTGCSPVDAGTTVVFGASPGAAPRVDAMLNVSLGNLGERRIILATDDEVVDQVDYDGAPQGRAWQVDETGALCLAPAGPDNEYAEGNAGSPGLANPTCPPALGEGMCLDDGVPRETRPPAAGSVQVTEWMASPVSSENRTGEWVEVLVGSDADLNGLTWSDLTGPSDPLESTACIEVAAGTLLVFARSDDPALNGGLPYVDYALPISLNNENETISLVLDGTPLDAVAYDKSEPGAAAQLDDFGVRCLASTPYGAGDLGTPGAPNPLCP